MEALRVIALLLTVTLTLVNCREIRREAETDPSCLLRGNWMMGTTSKEMQRHEYGTHKDISDWKACDVLCKADSTCNFWSYSMEHRTCQLMDKAVEKGTDEKFIAGPVGCSRCEEDNIDYYGRDIGSAMTASWKQCQEACQLSDRCTCWTWIKGDASGKNKDGYDISRVKTKCHLKTSMVGRIKLVGAVSGRRDCPSRTPKARVVEPVPTTKAPTKSCGWIKDGGCHAACEERISLEGTGHTEQTCRMKCQLNSKCGVFLLGKPGSPREGDCRLYKYGAETSCKAADYYKKDWAMYRRDCETATTAPVTMAKKTENPDKQTKPSTDKCTKHAFDGRPKEWSNNLKSVSGKSFYSKAECQSECESEPKCNWFRIKKSADKPYGACELYETATYSGAHEHNFETYQMVPCVKCSKHAFDGRPKEWRIGKSISGKSFYTKAECQSQCESEPKCNWFRIKKSADKPYGACELYETATYSGAHEHNFETYQMVSCHGPTEPPTAPPTEPAGKCPDMGGFGDKPECALPKEGERGCLEDSDCVPGTEKCCSDGCNLICTKVVKPTKAPLTLPPEPTTAPEVYYCQPRTWLAGSIDGMVGGVLLGRHFNVEDYQTCDQLCMAEAEGRCKFFVYSEISKQCQMVHDKFATNSDIGYTSGKVGCSGVPKIKKKITEATAKPKECKCDHGLCDVTDEGKCLKFASNDNRWHCRQPNGICPDGKSCFDHNGSKYYSQVPKAGC